MLENTLSTKFRDTSQNKMNLLMAMLQNNDLRKWVYYLTDNPSEEPDIPVQKVINEHFNLNKFSDDIQQMSKVILFIDPVEGIFRHNKPSAEEWAISIALPNEFWFIKETGKERVFEIAHRIALCIDDQRLAGIGKALITSYKVYNINQRWTQLTLYVEVVNSNLPVPNGQN